MSRYSKEPKPRKQIRHLVYRFQKSKQFTDVYFGGAHIYFTYGPTEYELRLWLKALEEKDRILYQLYHVPSGKKIRTMDYSQIHVNNIALTIRNFEKDWGYKK